ncbi:polysaccharide biosynthesis/export family protein [Pseudomonas sp. TH41]|uniref:polysaccharide biosynthesis/export family protein n=1 Tax=Pseudomonas sp. TH41 TaxID=2796405 RepID=UPI0019149D5E|nr:polysaccharide biosynthesis/export family protein [Pseudomonas sp. TH41]MBK5354670.1 polysaccharide biosynthesis/export family protein [Pseudomonas sp. TH41]
MLRLFIPVLCTLAILHGCTQAILPGVSSADEKDTDYTLKPGDNVVVSVWGEDKMREEVRVLPDGSITFPLAGKVDVHGLDSTGAAKKIALELEKYIPDPNVSVVIKSTEGNLVYVQGKVVKPGSVQIPGSLDVLQTLSMAGGLDKFADKDEIKVIRRKGSKQEVLPVHYSDLISGKNMSTNIQLQAGDTLVVP